MLNLHQSSRMACSEQGCMWPMDQITSPFYLSSRTWHSHMDVTLTWMSIWPLCEEKAFSFHPFHCPCQTMLCHNQPPLWQAMDCHTCDIYLSSCSVPLPQHTSLELSDISPIINILVVGPASILLDVILSASSGCITEFCIGMMALARVLHCKWIYLNSQVPELLAVSAMETLQRHWGIFVASCSETAPPNNFHPFPTPFWAPLARRDQERLW